MKPLPVRFWIRIGLGSVCTLLVSLVLLACSGGPTNNNSDAGTNDQDPPTQPAVSFTDAEKNIVFKLSPLPAIPPDPTNKYADNPKAAHLGQYLYYEARISANGKISCATCHAPDKGFGDNLPVSEGMKQVTRHAPVVWNTAYNRWFFWDGRVDSLWAQAAGPIEEPKEMGYSRLELVHFIDKHADIKAAYNAIFDQKFPDVSDTKRFPPKGMPGDDAYDNMDPADQKLVTRVLVNVAKAIAAYERKIISKDAPFDTFVEGWKNQDKQKLQAISESAQKGLKLFIGKARCISCHFGPNFTNREFHNIGLSLSKTLPRDVGRFDAIDKVKNHPFNGMSEYSDIPKDHKFNDKLRYLTQISHNLGEFKTPTLRNVATSAPYMHDGRFKALEDVLKHYSTFPEEPAFSPREELLIKLDLKPDEIQNLIEFLKTLTGKPLPATLLKQPDKPMP